ncbi:CBS domain-containing protein [Deinococcus sp.]|uniref:CBS domain-containing protein n=1 Tax=Deinococcus sp. TaxID=47478 RepID=UPI0025E28311|nr:CBS domain-containing protein [Deinococcus sp.]
MRVREQMSAVIISVEAKAPLGPALLLMQSSSLRCLPVVDRGRLLGRLLASDLRLGAAPPDAQVSEYAVATTDQIRPDMPIERAAFLMLRCDVRGLPVIDAKGHLVGVITVKDLLRTVVEAPPVMLWK